MSFRFKQFFVDDSRCGMKVGTDGVLLGAWADAALNMNGGRARILDVGTGSGLIALMLAQRNPDAEIIGIDIDETAVMQAQLNFSASKWGERLSAESVSLQEYAVSHIGMFDAVVSNPPYFSNSLKAPDEARTTARHTDTLTLGELVRHTATLLKAGGVFSVVLPKWEEQTFLSETANSGLALYRRLNVQGRAEKPVKRLLLGFIKTTGEQNVIEENLILEEGLNQRTEEYARLAKEFYL